MRSCQQPEFFLPCTSLEFFLFDFDLYNNVHLLRCMRLQLYSLWYSSIILIYVVVCAILNVWHQIVDPDSVLRGFWAAIDQRCAPNPALLSNVPQHHVYLVGCCATNGVKVYCIVSNNCDYTLECPTMVNPISVPPLLAKSMRGVHRPP